MDLVVSVYNATRRFPKEEIFTLTSQMRRASISLPSNIAEGKGRQTDRDRVHFYSHARGSLLELETQIQIAQRLGYVSPQSAKQLLTETAQIGGMLNALIEAIRPKENTRSAA